ncbi:MAG: SsrA-binding protein [Owenweeksia sp.]|nr:SsrA-binding protein [Owenweeksia sp.]MBF98092.1 SsrA-binding protein [Owenweeksia sp.]HBF19836.1 SsrA-binding protein [Cryomorphaceae bacterium]HCQ15734.1 SsrA-binding protein [Cryomorphaceae bacterium]|tara:strand:+ start:855 stop:1310 length:456 start_codon:yes stop_codon:yes gene_type:complete
MAKDFINIKNRKARFQYEIQETFVAGIMLLGTEIKSVRDSKVSLGESYCYFKSDELFIKNMHIGEYSHGNINNHDPLRERKLLLQKRELSKLQSKMEQGGNLTIVPLRLFINDRGLAKLEIALGAGKKLHDKRNSLKEKAVKREMDRKMKY